MKLLVLLSLVCGFGCVCGIDVGGLLKEELTKTTSDESAADSAYAAERREAEAAMQDFRDEIADLTKKVALFSEEKGSQTQLRDTKDHCVMVASQNLSDTMSRLSLSETRNGEEKAANEAAIAKRSTSVSALDNIITQLSGTEAEGKETKFKSGSIVDMLKEFKNHTEERLNEAKISKENIENSFNLSSAALKKAQSAYEAEEQSCSSAKATAEAALKAVSKDLSNAEASLKTANENLAEEQDHLRSATENHEKLMQDYRKFRNALGYALETFQQYSGNIESTQGYSSFLQTPHGVDSSRKTRVLNLLHSLAKVESKSGDLTMSSEMDKLTSLSSTKDIGSVTQVIYSKINRLKQAQVQETTEYHTAKSNHEQTDNSIEELTEKKTNAENLEEKHTNEGELAQLESDKQSKEQIRLEKELTDEEKNRHEAHLDYQKQSDDAKKTIEALNHIIETLKGGVGKNPSTGEGVETAGSRIETVVGVLSQVLDQALTVSEQVEESELTDKREFEETSNSLKSQIDSAKSTKENEKRVALLSQKKARGQGRVAKQRSNELASAEQYKSELDKNFGTLENLEKNHKSRKAARQAEIDGLQQAYDVLNKFLE